MSTEHPPNHAVMIAIDWENIRRGASTYGITLTPDEFTYALLNVASVFGGVSNAKVFGDWSLRPAEAREFSDLGFTPHHAPRTTAGKDRTDPSIMLEVYDWIRDHPECETIILASGDADYMALIQRAQRAQKRIILCAFSQAVARDLLATAPLFPLEAELDLPIAPHGDVHIPEPAPGPNPGATSPDEAHLVTFINEMNRTEARLAFVGFSMLCNQWMPEWGIGANEFECRRLIEDWINEGVTERHQVENPNQPSWPTTAIRLVRESPAVRRVLGHQPVIIGHNITMPSTADPS